MELLRTITATVACRPYVFVFLVSFLAIAWPTLGRWRTLLFLVVGYVVAFASEYSSIRNGFPYGDYWYRYDAFDPYELIVGGRPPAGSPEGTAGGVPFFDSLSYSFMAWASYALATFFTTPLYARKGWDLQLADTPATRTSWTTWALATFFMGLLDVIVDPVAFQGKKWFLGQIYGYRVKGDYFQVPFSNQLGWWLVSAVTFFIVAALDRRFVSPDPARSNAGMRWVPLRALLGPLVWIGCATFQIVVAFWIEERQLGFAGAYILSPIVAVFLARAVGGGGRASRDEIDEHARAHPPLVGSPGS